MYRRPSSTGAVQSTCVRCSAPVLTQLVGERAALSVIADLTHLSLEEEAAVRADPNRLTWCLKTSKYGGTRLTWRTEPHPRPCPHQHVADHHCNGPPPDHQPPPSTLF